LPPSLGPAPSSGVAEIGGWGSVPTLESLGLSVTKAGSVNCIILTFTTPLLLGRYASEFFVTVCFSM
jgi:hypothetical protein